MRSRIRRCTTVATLLACVSAPSTLLAQSLRGDLTVDNSFAAYLSTSVGTQGTQIASGTNWTTTYSFSGVSLTPGETYYLQVRGADVGVIAGFLGDFTLDGAFQFANGTSFLTTNTSDWFASATGFGLAPQTPGVHGLNGASPWGTRPNIDASAEWIWTEDGCIHCTRYFWTSITPAAQIPEPATQLLLGAGVVGLVIIGRQRRGA
jgi:hypothetical protein